jgi:hypothetical protein
MFCYFALAWNCICLHREKGVFHYNFIYKAPHWEYIIIFPLRKGYKEYKPK